MHRDVVGFVGPSIPLSEARAILDADYRGPASMGDVFRAACGRPRAILLVDGVFERVPSVWHKEVLFALSEGIHVAGSSSMGA
ncbi:MAG TPA: TfuA-like protein, partial [Polyangiaceae bacterium]